jgi:hypothetical protein
MCRGEGRLMLALSASRDDRRKTDQTSAAPEYNSEDRCNLQIRLPCEGCKWTHSVGL